MRILFHFLPILLFVLLYVGSGIYFTATGVDNAFHQLPPVIAMIPAIVLGLWMQRGTVTEKMERFLDGVRHRDIITMCLIFLLAGAFSVVTKSIGSIESTVNLALSFISPQFLLVGLFITTAFVATAIGTSMGTIATIGPIAAGLAAHGMFPASIGIATVVGGAMFGDNLSIISDTTIAAVMSQKASMKDKFRLNSLIAIIASIITIVILLCTHESATITADGEYSLVLVLPYLLILVLAILGINVFIVLTLGLVIAYTIGCLHHGYTIMALAKDMTAGFASMQDIMLLSLMVGGLSGLAGQGSKDLATYLSNRTYKGNSKKMAQLVIAKVVSIFDILLANNTVAIIFSGEIARDIAKKNRIPSYYSAAWLDIFSCVFQGLIPYGAQLLLASAIAGVSPLSIVPHVYYCYALFVVAIGYICLRKDL